MLARTATIFMLLASCSAPRERAVDPRPAARTGAAAAGAGAVTAGPEVLSYSIREGDTDNYFYRRGPIAAHVLATSGGEPRVVVAFPAGNSGVGLWFARAAAAVTLEVDGAVAPVEDGAMRGVRFTLRAGAAELRVAKAILGGNWSLREWTPPGLTFPKLVNQVSAGPPARIARATLDGAHHIEVLLAPQAGATASLDGDALVLRAAPGAKELRVEVTATTDETPLSPIAMSELLVDAQGADPGLLRALAFLSYREALLAGSWRFLGYFGRDTLLSVRLLMAAARPEVTEAGLGSVIDRLSPAGEVAHYEESGEFVTLRHLSTPKVPRPADLRTPYYEYKMVDDDFMLAPVLADYVATPAGRERAAAFLARKTPGGEGYAAAVRRNLDSVLRAAGPYAARPVWKNLVAFDPSYPWGEWRDSNDGNGGGRISWNVNAALVPAALRGAAALLRLPAFGPDEATAGRADQLAAVWESRAPEHFRVSLGGRDAKRRVAAYAKRLGIDAAEAMASIGDRVEVAAISLDARGRPIPIQHSDDGFLLLFGSPAAAALAQAADRILMPFPAGLRTPVGVVVANPAYASGALQTRFTTSHYHGTVVWSWQQAMLAAGLRRQIARTDLDAATRDKLVAAENALWDVILAMKEQRAGELWSFKVEGGRIGLLPFGEARGQSDESNAAQLWSTVYLAIRKPSN